MIFQQFCLINAAVLSAELWVLLSHICNRVTLIANHSPLFKEYIFIKVATAFIYFSNLFYDSLLKIKRIIVIRGIEMTRRKIVDVKNLDLVE